MVPPIRLYRKGVLNEDAYKIIFRNTRLPHSLQGDIDGEIAACRMGAERLRELFARYGRETVEACFDATIGKCAETFRREIFPKIPDGTYAWEDYIEHDGVDPPRLHPIRMTMTKTADKILLDLRGTHPQTKGPINWPGNYCEGRFLKKWIAVVLRNLAESPQRAAELDVNEGVCDIIDVVFPEEPTIVSPRFPAPTNARSFTILRLIGIFAGVLAHAVDGYMPADQETIRYWGLHGFEPDGTFFLLREVLGGGSGGRYYADGSDVIHIVPNSKNLPAEFAETRFPVVIERLGLATDSGGAGKFRGGLGYDKHVRLLQDAAFISTADRSILSCYGVKGGKAGLPYAATINPGTTNERRLPGLNDDVPLKEGDILALRTTGGGGWGDPLERDPGSVLLDVMEGKVSQRSAHEDYGVLVTGEGEDLTVDAAATERVRAQIAKGRGVLPLIDRGAGYDELARREKGAAPGKDGVSDHGIGPNHEVPRQ
jgi:N-methylhydantoinase B